MALCAKRPAVTGAAKRGLVLFAHGSPDPKWKESIIAIERRVREKLPGTVVGAAYLKECEPDIESLTGRMTAAGVTRVTVTPLFLAVGAHAAKDFPRIERELKERFPAVAFEWTDVIGTWDDALDALAGALAKRMS